MKNIFKLSFLAVLSVGILASCAKKTNNPPAVTSSMSATINSVNWTAASVSAAASSGTIAIVGTNSNSTELEIALPSTVTPGTYSPSLGSSYDVLYTATASDIYYISSGSIVITSNANGVVSGTFSGTLTDANSNTMTCTNGAFTGKYQ